MKMNGIMIDCSRLMERHEYYFHLLDFMADWGMNTLALHFSDDHGLGIELKGFKKLAMPNAFTARELKRLIQYAADRKIEIIPELETFGHTRFVTDHPDFVHLYAGKKTSRLTMNAVDPLSTETFTVMGRLLKAVAEAFPAKYLHIGCDEVNMATYCKGVGREVSDVWVDYVNRIIGMTRTLGKTPMMWADHPTHDPHIARRLRKDVVLVDWRYRADVKAGVSRKLAGYGFEGLAAAPSLACYGYRFFPTRTAFTNVTRMSRFAAADGYRGVLTTIWCPYRYFQSSLYYGIAFSAEAVRSGGKVDMRRFQRKFARKVFGTELTASLRRFLSELPRLEIHAGLALKLVDSRARFTPQEDAEFAAINVGGARALKAAADYAPRTNRDIYDAMVLGAWAAWICSEYRVLSLLRGHAERKRAYNRELKEVRRQADRDWDLTRFADSPQKGRSLFSGEGKNYALVILSKLKQL